MRHLCTRRVLGSSLFVLLLAGGAWVLYAWLPPEPRWVRRGPIMPLGFAWDGKSFMTGTASVDDLANWDRSVVLPDVPALGPVQFRDIATGHEAWSVLRECGRCWPVAVADDLTHLAAVTPPLPDADSAELRVFDLKTGHERRASIEQRTAFKNLSFSPAGTLLILEAWDLQPDLKDIYHIYLYDTASVRLVAKCVVTTLPSDDLAPAVTRRIQRLLDETTGTAEFINPMPLKQALQLFYERFAARGQDLPIVVDINAFKEAGDAQPNSPYDDEVKLPAVPKIMAMDTALRLILSQIKSKNADYLIRGDFIELTTKNRTARKRSRRWRWSPDGKALLEFTTDANGNARLRRITADGERTTKLHGAGDWLDISADGKTLITEPPRATQKAAPRIDTILVWDLPAATRRGIIRVDSYNPDSWDNPVTFAGDSRTLLITMGEPQPGNMLGAWDLDTQKWLGRMPLDMQGRPFVPEPGSVLLRHYDGDVQLAWYRLRPFAKLWQRQAPGDVLRTIDYLPDVERLAVLSGEGGGSRLQLLDARTGRPTLDLALNPDARHHWLSRGSRFALVTRCNEPDERGPIRAIIEEHILALLLPNRQRDDTPLTSVRVFDPATGAELCRIGDVGAEPIAISRDGSALILYQHADGDGDAAVICYDVPPARPWRFILGIPLALSALLITLRFGWRRVRRGARVGGANRK
jgi:hypothetical protein